MYRNFCKATLISVAASTVALFLGLRGGLPFLLFAVPALQIAWTIFCVVRIVELRRNGVHKPDAPQYDRDSYGFALGGSVSSIALLMLIVVLSQVI
jgi:hypothetical protein